MARKKINYYVFTPGAANAGTVKLLDNLQLSDILMITNVTRNTVIYNFGDPNRGGSVSYNPSDSTSFAVSGTTNSINQGVTTLTLAFNTAGQSSTDVLQIYVESAEQRIRTHDFGIDAVERQRVGIPRSMIDADFEYGLQATKWAGFASWRSMPTTYEQAGTDFFANSYAYTTIVTGANVAGTTYVPTSSFGGTPVNLNILNQGNAIIQAGTPGTISAAVPGTVRVDTAPLHYFNDYKLVVRQDTYYGPTAGAINPNQPGAAQYITNIRPITLANGGTTQRTFSVTSTANFNVGDIVGVVGLPCQDGTVANTALQNVTGFVQTTLAGGTNQISITFGGAIAANSMLAVEYGNIGSGQFELMSVPAAGTTNTAFAVIRNVLGTNSGNATIPAGNRVWNLANATATAVSAIEPMRIDAIDSVNNLLTVTRSWFNSNANVQFAAGSIVSPMNFKGNTYANLEIVKVSGGAIQSGAAVGAQNAGIAGGQAVPAVLPTLRQFQFANNSGNIGNAFGSFPVTSAPPGSYVIGLSGMFVAGNVDMPMVMINANTHGLMSFTTGPTATFITNANAYVSTIQSTGSLLNSNVEGVFMNQIADTNYIGFFPKYNENRPIGWPLMSNEIAQGTLRFKKGAQFTGANILYANNYVITSNAGIPSLITVTTQQPHGVVAGLPVQVKLSKLFTANGTTAYNVANLDTHGSGIFVTNFANATSFSYIAKNNAVIPNPLTGEGLITANITPFPTSLVKHRPLDGGTNIGINSPVWGFEATRQTRKYFRYQSGKGMMFTTGTQFNPVFTAANIVANATAVSSSAAITVVTTNEHGLQRGANVSIYNVGTSGYNNYYLVNNINSAYSFTVMAKTDLGSAQPTFLGNSTTDSRTQARVVVSNWQGAKVRSGMFDDTNGIFWEYDGQYLWAVKRSATYDGSGTVTVQINDNKVNGDSNSRFADTLRAGDIIQIRGMNYDVIQVASQNTLYVSPAYRGVVNAQAAPYSVIRETRVRSANFNLDRLDGTGPSGYVVNLNKMQMVGIQFTWYGAGFIDWGMRTTDGKMIWAHRVKNNNVNDEGYMRSGNLPARYQAVNRGAVDSLAIALSAAEGVSATGNIQVFNIDEFSPATATTPGIVMIDNELIAYTAKYPFFANTGGNLQLAAGTSRGITYTPYILGAQRALTGAAVGAHTQGTGVVQFGVTASPDLNHWGSAVILDGDFDVDRTYSFTYNVTNAYIASAVGVPQTLFMVRLAPSLGVGLPGDLGVKDLLNRAQLLLQNCYVNVGGTNVRCLLQGIVNPVNISAAQWQNVNTGTQTFQPSFSQFVSNVTVGNLSINAAGTQVQWASVVPAPSLTATYPTAALGSATAQLIPFAFGGEQLFSIPVSSTNSGFVDLSKVKEVGGTIVPGNTVYPNGPEIIAFNIVPITGTGFPVDLQLTWIESQA